MREQVGKLARELKKWAVAAKYARQSESGRLLWYATVGLTGLVLIGSYYFQLAQFEISAYLSSPSMYSGGAASGAIQSNGAKQAPSFYSTAGVSSAMWLAVLTVGGSTLAALYISLLGKIKWHANMLDRTAIFGMLAGFGGSHVEINDDLLNMPIDIVLAQYRVVDSRPAEISKERRVSKVLVGGNEIVLGHRPIYNDLKDSRAAQRIHAELEKLHFKNLRIVQDTDSRSPDRVPACEILIGLCVNSRVNDLMTNMPKPHLFSIREEGLGRFSVSLATTGPSGITAPPSRTTRYENEDGHEVMLVAKAKHHGHVQIVIGGLSSEGTLICADTFCDRLVEFSREMDASSKRRIDSNVFAAVLKCHPGDFPSPVIQALSVVA